MWQIIVFILLYSTIYSSSASSCQYLSNVLIDNSTTVTHINYITMFDNKTLNNELLKINNNIIDDEKSYLYLQDK